MAVIGTLALPGTAITQTYSTADVTVAAATYVAPTITVVTTTVTKTNSSPYGFSTGDADKVVTLCGAVPADIASLNTQLVALAADVLVLRKLVNTLVDALQAVGILT